MGAGRVVVCLVGAALLSGCAGARARQDMTHLQSQVNLLEERVGQLERSGTTGTASSPSWSETTPTTTSAATPSETGTSTAGAIKVTRHAKSKHARRGSTREIQQALKNAGFYQGAVDGKTGPKTEDAIKEFQRAHGLKDDGVVGRQTWAKLSTFLEAPAAGEPKAGGADAAGTSSGTTAASEELKK